MALFIPGMLCSISGQRILTAADAVVFPAFVSNEADPIYGFSDAVVKADVFSTHPLAAKAQARYEEFERRAGPRGRYCLVCGQRIADPDDYLALGHLIDESAHALYRYNYAHFHRSCLTGWPGLASLLSDVEALSRSDAWKGDGLRRVIEDMTFLAAGTGFPSVNST